MSVLFSIAQVLLVSKWSIWWGGHCYGPRLLTDIVPCLMLLMLPAMDWISRGAILRLLFGLLLFAVRLRPGGRGVLLSQFRLGRDAGGHRR